MGTLGRTSREVIGERSVDKWLLPVGGRLVVAAGIGISALDIAILRHGRFILTPVGMIGVALLLAGLSLYVVSRLYLGRFYSEVVRILPEHRLIMKGPYRIIRHPIYLAVILEVFSGPLILNSLYGFLVMLVLIPMLLRRIRIEEKVLVSRFGQEYAEYAHNTKRLIPHIY